MKKKVKPADAYVQTIEAFTNHKNAPIIYNVANLTSINLKPPKANNLDPEKYFTNYRNEIATAYKDGKIDIQVFMEDLAAMDVIEDVFKVRMEIYETKGDMALRDQAVQGGAFGGARGRINQEELARNPGLTVDDLLKNGTVDEIAKTSNH